MLDDFIFISAEAEKARNNEIHRLGMWAKHEGLPAMRAAKEIMGRVCQCKLKNGGGCDVCCPEVGIIEDAIAKLPKEFR